MLRRELHLPLTCALIGVLVAICWGMVHRQSAFDPTRVHLDHSLPLAVAGLVGGAVLGSLLERASVRWPPLTRALEAVLVPVLVGSIAGPLGWITRDAGLDWSGEEAIVHAGAWGAGVGLALYASVQVCRAVRSPKVAAEPARAPDCGGGK